MTFTSRPVVISQHSMVTETLPMYLSQKLIKGVKKSILCIHTWVHVCAGAHVRGCVMCAYVWKSEVDLGYNSSHIHSLHFMRTGALGVLVLNISVRLELH